MTGRHTAALALAGWYLTVYSGKTVPEDCPDCAVTLEQQVVFGGPPYTTKAECEKAGQNIIEGFYADAKEP